MTVSLFILRSMGPLPCQSNAGGQSHVNKAALLVPMYLSSLSKQSGPHLSRRQEPSGLCQGCTLRLLDGGEWGPALTPCLGQGNAWLQQQSVFVWEVVVLVVHHPAKQRSNYPEVIHNLPILRRSETGDSEEGKSGLQGQLGWGSNLTTASKA